MRKSFVTIVLLSVVFLLVGCSTNSNVLKSPSITEIGSGDDYFILATPPEEIAGGIAKVIVKRSSDEAAFAGVVSIPIDISVGVRVKVFYVSYCRNQTGEVDQFFLVSRYE